VPVHLDRLAEPRDVPSRAITKPASVSYGPRAASTPVTVRTSSRLSSPSASISPPGTAAESARDVVLVADVADDLLDEVLQRDDACGAAVLVDDDRHVVALAAHLRHGRQHPLAARQQLHLADDVGHPHAARLAAGHHQVAHVQEADDVVLRGAGHRVARVRLLRGLRDGPAQRHAGVQEGHLGARQHHLAQLALARGEDVVDELALVLGERLVRRHHAAQLLLRDGLALGAGSPPSSRTTASVLLDSSQMTGRDSVAMRSRVGAKAIETPSGRCSASRLGASSLKTSEK
jgi:hypothetical protein